jgi:hypothetical protein
LDGHLAKWLVEPPEHLEKTHQKLPSELLGPLRK